MCQSSLNKAVKNPPGAGGGCLLHPRTQQLGAVQPPRTPGLRKKPVRGHWSRWAEGGGAAGGAAAGGEEVLPKQARRPGAAL